ncbi:MULTISPECIES: hypothetical protein [Serratia]|jgi:hypothetical protein|nr:hypothetical protein [Serratia marcescens]EIF1297674.1 hypothetical protein [Salmonella enterica]EIF2004955.1 hypothetical protein [Salmonella enterica subsp. enterica serovar Montevideo]EKB0025817.1 hypothetical protein [Salmonella enterica subsp. enterica serovar Schwarzengrund]MBK4469260.1 hypothetical protein [Enterobacter asburiae]MCC7652233.1 hypothetical protein [Klebsiella variicola]QQD62672.1 hypothetical protein HIX68_0024155 [Salmonella enterica subsp. enterica serovar Westhampt
MSEDFQNLMIRFAGILTVVPIERMRKLQQLTFGARNIVAFHLRAKA